MTSLAFIELIKLIGGAAGGILSIVALLTLLFKKPKKWLSNTIKETTQENFKNMEKEFQKLHEYNEKAEITSCNMLRHDITVIYEQYKGEKKLPGRIREDLCILYEDYDSRGGNSYIHMIMEEMMKWEVI